MLASQVLYHWSHSVPQIFLKMNELSYKDYLGKYKELYVGEVMKMVTKFA
jgi:hypothetical protein